MKPEKQSKLERAKKRVEAIKGFYSHLLVYILVNLFIILAALGVWEALFQGYPADFKNWFSWNVFITPIFWGLGIIGHAVYVFGKPITFFKKWEERKIKEFMENDKL